MVVGTNQSVVIFPETQALINGPFHSIDGQAFYLIFLARGWMGTTSSVRNASRCLPLSAKGTVVVGFEIVTEVEHSLKHAGRLKGSFCVPLIT